MKEYKLLKDLGVDYDAVEKQPIWLLGSSRVSKDKTDYLIETGTWSFDKDSIKSLGSSEKKNKKKLEEYKSLVKTIKPGELVVLKSTSTISNQDLLPFKKMDSAESVTYVKAVGVVESNPGDGESLEVKWIKFDELKKFYLYYPSRAIVPIKYNAYWKDKEFINFVFYDEPQRINKFVEYKLSTKFCKVED